MNSVVIVAAGTGSRMNMDINKQFIKIYNKEVVAHTIDVFYNNENIDQLLFTRHISKKARAAGCRTKGPKKRQKEDDIKFEENLINLCKNLIIN